jgi:hypothetical protein
LCPVLLTFLIHSPLSKEIAPAPSPPKGQPSYELCFLPIVRIGAGPWHPYVLQTSSARSHLRDLSLMRHKRLILAWIRLRTNSKVHGTVFCFRRRTVQLGVLAPQACTRPADAAALQERLVEHLDRPVRCEVFDPKILKAHRPQILFTLISAPSTP